MLRIFSKNPAAAACRALLTAALCCGAGLPALAAPPRELTPLDFTTLIPVETPADAPIYSLDLPFAVYERSQRSPLLDVRVFNSLGKAEPFLITPAVQKQALGPDRVYPCFAQNAGLTRREHVVLLRNGEIAQPADEKHGSDANDIQRAAQGVLVDFGRERPSFSRISVVPAPGALVAAAAPDKPYSADSADREPTRPLMQTSDGQRGLVISVQVYVSRDLKRWRQVESRLPLGRLDVHGQTLEILDLPAQAVTARYLLILPAADAKLFAIKEVLTREQPSTVTLTQKTRLSGRWDDSEQAYGFDLPRSLPVLELEPALDSQNYLLRADLLTRGLQTPGRALPDRRGRNNQRPSAEALWQVRDRLLLYAMNIKYNLQRNAPVPFEQAWLHPDSNNPALSRNPTLLLRPQSRQEWRQTPTLDVRWASRRLYFMAGGPGPYTLAVGSARATAPAEEAALRDLSREAAPATLRLDEEITQTPSPVSGDDSGAQRWLLWSILLSGAAFMAFFAVQLLRQPRA